MNDLKFSFPFNAIYSAILIITLAIAPTTAVFAENGSAPLNYFLHSHGPVSMPIMHLAWVFVALLVAIFVVIAVLLMVAVFRKRPPKILVQLTPKIMKIKGSCGFILGPAYPPAFCLFWLFIH